MLGVTCALDITHSSKVRLINSFFLLPVTRSMISPKNSTVNGPMLSHAGSMAFHVIQSSSPVLVRALPTARPFECLLRRVRVSSLYCINRHSTCPSHSLVFLYRIMEQPHPLVQSSSPSVSIPPLFNNIFWPLLIPIRPKIPRT